MADERGGIVAVRITGPDGGDVIVVAVRPSIVSDAARREATLDVLRTVFPNQTVALATSTSDGLRVCSDTPEIEHRVSNRMNQKRTSLDWRRYSFA
jgi:hypothetical protein